MNDALDFTPDTALFKKDWLPLEQAIQKVARFEHEFGEAHLTLACHAALASILTPELVNLIRINFLETSVEWIAECDLLLSSLCQPINQGVYEIEPQIRQVLLVALQTHPKYGSGRLEEIAHFLYRYSETDFVNELPFHIKRTYQWISGAYIDPDATIQNMFDLLKNVQAEDFMSRMPDYLHIGKTLAMIANLLEMTSLQVELDDLIGTAQLSTLYWTGDKENLLSLLPENTSDLDEITHALTKPVVNWLATSEFVTSDERAVASSPISQSMPVTESPVRTERKPVTIFCSYTHEDEELQRELAEYLAPLQAQGLITYWHDPLVSLDNIEGHKKVVDEYLSTAQIILLLISANFMASDYYYEFEIQRAMERHKQGDVRVIPILARSVNLTDMPFIHLQVLPINARPIHQWKDRSLAFADVVSGIERVVEELQKPEGDLHEIARQKEISTGTEPLEVFLVYAHDDAAFLIELEKHLSPLYEQGLITTWSDRQIPAGADRRQVIDMHLERASLILLLVSPHFLMSDECNYEARRALHYLNANGTRVIPIIIRPCMWKEASFAGLKVLPSDGKPISVREDRNTAFADIVRGILMHTIEKSEKLQALPEIPRSEEIRVTTQPFYVFFVYAREDQAFLIEIENYLYPLHEKGVISWTYHNDVAGLDRKWVIGMHMEQASLILLFVSLSFLSSDDCDYKTQKALQLYQAGKARIIPIIIRPCIWEDTIFAYLQALPSDSRPITSWSNQDAAFADVANGILRAIEEPEKSQALPEISSPKKMQTITPPIKIFFVYAHEDTPFLVDLGNHLYPLNQQGLITMWSDRDIKAGSDWRQEIDQHLMRANIILLLVSPNFLTSNYCYGIEMKRAMERHEANEAHVIPIIVQPCEWRNAPFAGLQVLPTNAQPITRWSNQDEAFVDVANSIRRVVENLRQRVASPTIWNVPYRRNPFFIGREEVLNQLHRSLQANATIAPSHSQAITGLGGIGKTQIALEYVYRYIHEYKSVFWMLAGSKSTLISSYVGIASLLNLPERYEQDHDIVIQAVKHWLETNAGWLLIMDNADELDIIEAFLPRAQTGHILFTTRAHALGAIAQHLDIEKMEPKTGALLLLRRAAILPTTSTLEMATPDDQNIAQAISQELDGLPLALDQAGAYIEETQCSLSSYLAVYQSYSNALLRRRGGFDQGYPASVATTWSLTIEKVTQNNPAATDLLQLCAFLAPADIPEDIIVQGASYLGPSLAPIANDIFILDEMIMSLLSYSLLYRDANSRTLSIHRLVQVILQDSMSQEMQKLWGERAIRAVNAAFPEVEFAQWANCERCLPHALICAQWIEQEQISFSEAGYLLYKTASYLRERAQYTQAEPLFQQALAIQELALGTNHPDTAMTLHNLSLLYENMGNYTQAQDLLLRVLIIQEQVSGSEHPITATSLNNLAELYRLQGKYAEAEPLYERALVIDDRVLGAEHPQTATSLNNLAVLYVDQNRYRDAEPLILRALVIREQHLGTEHPDTAISLESLANLYINQARYSEAEPLLQRAAAIQEQALGTEHPSTANTLYDLAILYQKLTMYEASRVLYQRVLSIQVQVLGNEHPDTIRTRKNYTELLRLMGNPNEATRIEISTKPVFFFNMPLISQNEFYGRQKEKGMLFDRIRRSGSISIIGPHRIGKSWLMRYLSLAAESKLGAHYRVGYVSANIPACSTVEGFVDQAIEALDVEILPKIGKTTLSGKELKEARKKELSLDNLHHVMWRDPESKHPGIILLERVVRDLKRKSINPVLCIDSFDALLHNDAFDEFFFSRLRAIAQMDYLTLVVASLEPLYKSMGRTLTSPFFNIFEQISLAAFDHDEAVHFIKDKVTKLGFTPEEQEYLLEYGIVEANQWPPLRLQLAGQLLLDDKLREGKVYLPEDPAYWQDFKKRLEEAYQVAIG